MSCSTLMNAMLLKGITFGIFPQICHKLILKMVFRYQLLDLKIAPLSVIRSSCSLSS